MITTYQNKDTQCNNQVKYVWSWRKVCFKIPVLLVLSRFCLNSKRIGTRLCNKHWPIASSLNSYEYLENSYVWMQSLWQNLDHYQTPSNTVVIPPICFRRVAVMLHVQCTSPHFALADWLYNQACITKADQPLIMYFISTLRPERKPL